MNRGQSRLAAGMSLLLSCCGAALLPVVAEAGEGPRQAYTINDGWRFHLGAASTRVAAHRYDDSSWLRVSLPHTWNREDALDKERAYHRGIGWYRRRLVVPESPPGSRFYLHFEGANQVADVFLDGRLLERHVGGYTAFRVEITDRLRKGRPHVVAVRVNNAHDPDVPPLNADFTFYGGLYRDVWLIRTDPVHFDMLDHASSGVFITTDGTDAQQGRIRVRGTVVNASAGPVRVSVRHRLWGEEGRMVSEFEGTSEVAAGRVAGFRHESPGIPNPRLWSPEDPYLYRMVSEVLVEGTVRDQVEIPLGFRWFSTDPVHGFLLNGKPVVLRGTNRHQDRSGYGNAVPNEVHRQDLEMIRADGFNFVRLAHYPQDPAVLDAADRLGLLVWEEIPVVNLIATSDEFRTRSVEMLVEMIRQHYNHPCVVLWGYMNEVMLQAPDPVPDGYVDRLRDLAMTLQAKARAEDEGRLTAMALSKDETYNGSGLSEVSDVLGLNLYFGWYYGAVEDLGPFLDELHRAHPERALFVSEYGAGSDRRLHSESPEAFDFSIELQQRFLEKSVPQLMTRGYLVGSAVWNHFDFGSSHRQDTIHGINQKGLYDFTRKPKDVAFFMRAQYADPPVVHIAIRDYPRRAGSRPEHRRFQVPVYGNLSEVELSMNGASLEKKPLERRVARWTVDLRPGKNRFEVRGLHDGVEVYDSAEIDYEDRSPFFSEKPRASVEMAINAGAAPHYVDRSGLVWEGDGERKFEGLTIQGGAPKVTHHRIHLTDDDPLFQTAREGAVSYTFSVKDGSYEVEVGLAEIEDRAPGTRVFGIRVDASSLFADVDLASDYGTYTAVWRSTVVTASKGAGLTITVEPKIGLPLINALRLRRLP